MSFDKILLDIICCPVTHLPLELMRQTQLDRLNDLIKQSKIKARDNSFLEEKLSGALVTKDSKLAYPIIDGIPILIKERGILLSQLEEEY